MDRIENLSAIVRHEVEAYVSPSPNATLYFMENKIDRLYATVSIPHRHEQARVVVMARVAGDRVIIEEDITDRPLLGALQHPGIPREHLILAYLGEAIPTA